MNADGTVNGTPTDPLIPLPGMNRIPVGALASGGISAPVVGAKFLVDFVNESGAKYAMISASQARVATLDATERVDVGASSSVVNLGPSPSANVSRVGDGLQVFMPQGLLNGELDPGGGGSKIPIVDMPMQIVNPLPGLITYGNTRARVPNV